MDLFEVHEIKLRAKSKRKAQPMKTFYERARKYIGAIKMPHAPRKGAANVKVLVRTQFAAKHTR